MRGEGRVAGPRGRPLTVLGVLLAGEGQCLPCEIPSGTRQPRKSPTPIGRKGGSLLLFAKPPPNRPPPSCAGRSTTPPSSIALAFARAFCLAALAGIGLVACEPQSLPPIQSPTPPPTPHLTAEQRANLRIQEIYWRIDAIAANHPGVQYQAPTSTEVWKGCFSLLLEAKGLPPYDWGLTARDSFYGSIIGQAAKSNWPDFCRIRNGATGDWANVGTGKWDAALPTWGPKG